MRVWRICKATYAGSAFSGDGGLHLAGRWHHKGHRIVYTAQSLSLAALENLVHLGGEKTNRTFVQTFADIPEELSIYRIEVAKLPPDWSRVDSPVLQLREMGTRWILSNRSAVAQVPSAVTAGEFNYLLNPRHPDFMFITRSTPAAYDYDARILS